MTTIQATIASSPVPISVSYAVVNPSKPVLSVLWNFGTDVNFLGDGTKPKTATNPTWTYSTVSDEGTTYAVSVILTYNDQTTETVSTTVFLKPTMIGAGDDTMGLPLYQYSGYWSLSDLENP